MRRFATALGRLAVALLILGAAPATLLAKTAEPAAAARPLPELQPSAPIVLTDHQGRAFDSAADFAGRPMLVYFGYTYCPDVCPASLAKLSGAINALERSGAEIEDLVFLFVSVDPERDAGPELADYVALFHPALIGATGSPAEIAELAAAWRVAYGKSKGGGAEDYLVDHPPYAYGLDREHRVVRYLWSVASQEKLADQIGGLF